MTTDYMQDITHLLLQNKYNFILFSTLVQCYLLHVYFKQLSKPSPGNSTKCVYVPQLCTRCVFLVCVYLYVYTSLTVK